MSVQRSACGCAACRAAAAPPLPVANRPGLRAIRYRTGTHAEFLSAMIAGLSRDATPRHDVIPPATASPQPHEARPALRGLRTRDPDDPTIALLDAFAVTADILTFYTERLANEAYLGTAIERTSLQELGALVAYRLGRGAAAETTLAFSLERPPAPLPESMRDPGMAPPVVPTALTLPVGLRVQSVPGPDELPQTFETVEQIEARPEWNALPVARTKPWTLAASTSELWLAGATTGLSLGDRLWFGSGTPLAGAWEHRRVVAVEPDDRADRTRIGLDAPLTADHAVVSVMRKRLPVFGHNAPRWRSLSAEFRRDYAGIGANDPIPAEWPDFSVQHDASANVTVEVEGAHPDVLPATGVLIDSWWGGVYEFFRYEVSSVDVHSVSAFAVSGRATRLSLKGDYLPGGFSQGTPRDVTVYAAPERLALAQAPDASAITGTSLLVDGDATAMAKGRTILLAGTDAAGRPVSEALSVEAAEAVGPVVPGRPAARTRITLAAAPANPPTRATAVVFGNAARATHGETVTQLLGSGDARVPFAAYRLQQAPLTFVPAETPRGTASTLEVRVDDIRWTEVPTTANSAPADRVYETRDEPDGGISVVFGDGVHGARPSTGSTNVRARHRKGVGAAGNVRKDQLGIAVDRPLGLKGVTNPAPAVGGVDPETEADARRGIPIPVRTLGRTVSLLDYADFSLAFAGIGKAQATVLPAKGTGPLIVVTVADAAGAAPPTEVVARLSRELVRWGDPLVRVAIVPVRRVDFRIALKVDTDPDREREKVLAALERALRDTFGAEARELGDHVHASEVVAVAASVVGVVGVDLDHIYRGTTAALATHLIAAPAASATPVPHGAELLALAPDPFPPLLEMP